MSTTVFLGLGSNDQPRRNIRLALDLLQECFGALQVSPVFANAPLATATVAPDAELYFNLVVSAVCNVPAGELKQQLRRIEERCGRVHASGDCLQKNPVCSLDIDLLLYGDAVGDVDGVVLPHPDVLRRAYVLYPLSLLVPSGRHPQLQQTFAELWRGFGKSRWELKPVAPFLPDYSLQR